MKKLILAGAAIVVAMMAVPAAAFGADYTGSVSDNTIAPGGTITYTATTGQPEGTVATVTATPDVEFIAANSTTYAVGPGGNLSFKFRLSASTPNGTVVTLSVKAGTFSDTKTVTAVVATSSGLPSTGVDAAPYVWFGGGAAALGVALIVVVAATRRNRKPVEVAQP